jgi:hypothetical protein
MQKPRVAWDFQGLGRDWEILLRRDRVPVLQAEVVLGGGGGCRLHPPPNNATDQTTREDSFICNLP